MKYSSKLPVNNRSRTECLTFVVQPPSSATHSEAREMAVKGIADLR